MIEPNGDTWRAVREWAEGRLKQHRTQLEVTGLDITDTEALRAQIAELKRLLDLPKRLGASQTPRTE